MNSQKVNQKPLSYLDKHVRAWNLDRLRERLWTQVSQTFSQVNTTLDLSPEAQKRKQALENYPKLKYKVTITNEWIVIKTSAWELKFAFSHSEWGQTFENAHKPYSKEQLEALVKLFWNKPAPYLEILGLKNTCEYWNFNFYWSSSALVFNRDNAWGLYLHVAGVYIVNDGRGYAYSAFSI